MSKTKILLVASLSRSLVNFRGDYISDLIQEGYDVYCAAPSFEEEIRDILIQKGAQTIEINLARKGLNPLRDLKTIKQLRKLIESHQIDLVFPYTIKPVIYSSFAARKINVPTISLITGLGQTFSGVTFKFIVLQKVTELLYRRALRSNNAVIFQNRDDLQLFLDKKILSKTQSLHVVDGSGVNLNRFDFRANTKTRNSAIKFVVVARMMKSKGILLFIEAAKQLRKKYKNAEFHLVGGTSVGIAAGISEELLKKYDEDGVVVFHGAQKNVVPILSSSDIFVLPTFLREGIPRSILEALSIGLPVITTETPGCKETVEPNKNGILIPPREQKPLVEAMQFFLDNPEKIAEMGAHSRMLAETKFDVKLINKNLIEIIRQNFDKAP